MREFEIKGVVKAWRSASPHMTVVRFAEADREHHCYFDSEEEASLFTQLLHAEIAAHILAGNWENVRYDMVIHEVRMKHNLWWHPFPQNKVIIK